MAAECFCGCGRTIPLLDLARRSYNNRGRTVDRALRWWRDSLAESGAFPDEQLQRWLDQGDKIRDALARAVHGDPERPDLSKVARWEREGRRAQREAEGRRGLRETALAGLVAQGVDPQDAAQRLAASKLAGDRRSDPPVEDREGTQA
jgi:hypothetical protein